MKLLEIVLILAVIIPAIVNAGRLSDLFMDGENEELLLALRKAYQLNSQCNSYLYNYDPNGIQTYNDTSYQCKSDTLKQGYCILPLSKAIDKCNSDSTCGGYAITDMTWWHDDYDKTNEPAAQLFVTSNKPNPRASDFGRWAIYNKKCWKFATKRQMIR